jgi:hypothetical protein
LSKPNAGRKERDVQSADSRPGVNDDPADHKDGTTQSSLFQRSKLMVLSRVFGFAVATIALLAHVATSQAVPPPPTAVTGKEYSNFMDKDASGVLDPEQAVFWTGTGAALDTFDYTPGAPGPLRDPPISIDRPETDALAFDRDQFFFPLRGNTRDLVFSTDGDPDIYFEDTAGVGGTWATAGMINSTPGALDDVDAIELWGPDSTAAALGDDAFNYSLESRPPLGPGAVDPGLISVWHVPGSVPGALGPTAFPLLFVPELAAAISTLAPVGTSIDLLQNELDLDGMMLNIEQFEPEIPGGPAGLRVGSIHFTIDPIIDPLTGVVVFDGGEIFTWDFAFPGPIAPAGFLSHGGHLWDTAFGVMTTFGTATENVNGIESVPEPATTLLAALAITSFCVLGRRRRPFC